MQGKPAFALGVAVAVLALLAGCGMSDERLGRLVSDPAPYEVYTCEQLVTQEKTFADRVAELDALMRKVEADSAGSLVNAVAYKPEYIAVRGSLDQVRRIEAEKNCQAPAKR